MEKYDVSLGTYLKKNNGLLIEDRLLIMKMVLDGVNAIHSNGLRQGLRNYGIMDFEISTR